MAKFLDLTGLGSFKEKLQAWADGKFALKTAIPTKTSELTNDADFQSGTQVDAKINAKVAGVYKPKGSVATYADLPTEGNAVGDVYNIKGATATKNIKAGDNVVWVGEGEGENGDGWDNLGGKVDLSNYVQKEAGKGLSEANFTNDEKTKLAGLENYIHAKHTAHASGFYKVTVDAEGHVTGAVAVAKEDITKLGIPAQDTVYTHDSFTAHAAGFYKVTVNEEGHVTGATAVTKEDITGLGVPGQDTTYSDMKGATASAAGTHGLVPAPAAGDVNRYFATDGTFKALPAMPTAITEAEIAGLF